MIHTHSLTYKGDPKGNGPNSMSICVDIIGFFSLQENGFIVVI